MATPTPRPATSRRSASPTSARRRSCGTARPGEPIHNAIVWQDTRTGAARARVRRRRGRRPAARRRSACRCRPTSPARRSRWLLDNVDGARERAENGELAFGTMDTWVLWNLTGGTNGGVHVTDVTNASRTMLMDLETLDWHEPCARPDGHPALDAARDPLLERGATARRRAPRSAGGRWPGILGDQQAALFGQTCFDAGRREEHLRHRLVPARQHGRGDRPHRQAPDERRLQARRRPAKLRARGLDRGHRRADPVAARPAEDHRHRARGRGARPHRRRQRRRLLRARVLRPVRAVLARRRARRDRRPDRLRQRRATSPARRWRRRRGRARRSSTPPTTSPTSRSPSCAWTAA